MFKTIIIFIVLKIVEIAFAVFAWWLLCHVGMRIEVFLGSTDPMPFWIVGTLPVLLGGMIYCCGFMLYVGVKGVISANWEKAKKLSGYN